MSGGGVAISENPEGRGVIRQIPFVSYDRPSFSRALFAVSSTPSAPLLWLMSFCVMRRRRFKNGCVGNLACSSPRRELQFPQQPGGQSDIV